MCTIHAFYLYIRLSIYLSEYCNQNSKTEYSTFVCETLPACVRIGVHTLVCSEWVEMIRYKCTLQKHSQGVDKIGTQFMFSNFSIIVLFVQSNFQQYIISFYKFLSKECNGLSFMVFNNRCDIQEHIITPSSLWITIIMYSCIFLHLYK